MARRSRTTLAALLGALTLVACPAALAADGDLDERYDYDGVRTHDCGFDASSSAGKAVLQPDGKIILLTNEALDEELSARACVTRLTSTGAIDRDFGDEGDVVLSAGQRLSLTSAAVQPDGRIVVAGTATAEESDAVVFRLNADGSPDATVDADGRTTFGYTTSDDIGDGAADVALQPDGRIVVVGAAANAHQTHTAVARLTAAGGLDSTFDHDGRKVEPLDGEGNSASAVVIQGQRIVVAGRSSGPGQFGPGGFSVLRLESDGGRDESFGSGGNGHVFQPAGNRSASGRDVILAPDGGLLVAGNVRTSASETLAGVLRLDAAGRPDHAFGVAGVALADFGPYSGAGAVELTVDGKIAIAGESRTEPSSDGASALAIAKLTHAGVLDPSFDSDGMRVYDDVPIEASSLARDASGRLLAAGTAEEPGPNALGSGVARIQDSLPTIDLAGGTGPEGGVVPFAVNLNKTSGFPITVDYVTGDGTANRGRDYRGRDGQLTIPAGQSAAVLEFGAFLDNLYEAADEQFRVELSNPVNATLGQRIDSATIANTLLRGRCRNVVVGRKGIDILTGSPAGDRIVGRQDHDFLFGLDGDDCIRGERGDDEIYGGAGNDRIDGGSGNDELKGGAGNDRIVGGRGRNRYAGEQGNDAIYSRNGRSEIVDCGPGRDRVKADRSDKLRRCERVVRR